MVNQMETKLNKVLSWKTGKPVTDNEWAEDVKAESLDIKHDYQLVQMKASLERKKPFADRRRLLANKYPDSIKRKIEERLLIFEQDGHPRDLNGLDKENFIESETQDRVDYWNWKAEKISQSIERIDKEIYLRKRKFVERTPVGTTYYIDFDNGSDANDGLGSGAGNAWATLDKFTENSRSAGDVAIVRRGMTQTVSSDLTFTSSGSEKLPIVIEADFDDTWGDFANSTQTFTPVWGTKTMEASDTITGIAAGDWIYNSSDGDDPREYSYEVASVSGTTLTLCIPFRGTAGAGKTLKVMPDNPIWNTTSGNYQLVSGDDNNWKIQGLHFRGTDSSGVIWWAATGVFKDCILENDGTDECMNSDEESYVVMVKCRLYEYSEGWGSIYYPCRGKAEFCLFDGGTVDSYSNGVFLYSNSDAELIECEFAGNYIDINIPATSPDIIGVSAKARNCDFSGTYSYVSSGYEIQTEIGVEDYNSVSEDNRFYSHDANLTPLIQSETTTVRSGGGNSSIKVTPTTSIGATDLGSLKIFEYPVYLPAAERTITAYFKSSGTGNWTDDPTATEFYIELEYWETSTKRKRIKSTGTCDFNGDDSSWHSLTVTATPAQAGVAYIRCWYGKTKEAGSNIFYADTKVEIT